MDLTNSQRVALLFKHFVAKPSYAPRYVRHNLLNMAFARRTPLDLELPWFSYGAIDYLTTWLNRRQSVFEYGCGGSTLFFAKHCGSVLSVEDDTQWLDTVARVVRDRSITNVRLIHRPFDFRIPENFEHSAYVATIDGATYDVIIVDGQDRSFNERPICFRRAEKHVRRGGIIIVDDSWRPTYSALRHTSSAQRVHTYRSPGPLRYGVTSTDIYFY
jgi:hypothetical protein